MAELAVIIPTLNESRYVTGLLTDLRGLAIPHEVIVVDGGSGDHTLRVAARNGARTLSASRGRAVQMNAGARASRARWLCFFHADVRMPAAARDDLERVVRSNGSAVAVWRLAIEGAGRWFRLVEFGARVRDRLGGLPYGDQGLLLTRQLFEAVNGFPEVPIMEDVGILRRLRNHGPLVRLATSLRVSPRRWHHDGRYFTWVRNIALISGYLAGVSPERLARWYRTEPR